MECKCKEKLNITRGSDVILNVMLTHDGETINPLLIEGLESNLISGLGRSIPLTATQFADYIEVDIPWSDVQRVGLYSLEIKGVLNGLAWCAVGSGMIRYTSATEAGAESVTVEGDVYDVTMEAGYHYNDSPIAAVRISVDDEYGEPAADISYQQRELGLDFHNLRGNGITSIEMEEHAGDEAANIISIKTDADPEGTELQVRNGSRGNGIASSREVLSDEDGGRNTFTFVDDDGNEHELHTRNGNKGTKGDSVIVGQDDLPMAHDLGQSYEKAMSQKGVTDAVNRLEPSGSNQDFGIADEEGYYIVQFNDGHVLTKNFDSKKAVTDDDMPIVDLALADEDGYGIAFFEGGHIRTKNFDSHKVRVFNDGSRRIAFSYPVDCKKPLSDTWTTADSINTYVDQAVYTDNAVLYLPPQYTAGGAPSRLIIYCKHGASMVEPESDPVLSASGDGNIFKFLISIGYAVLAADGIPNDYASLIGISERAVGNYIAVQSTRAAYNYVTEHYNIAPDGVFVYGWSQGGHYAQNVADLCGLNVLAVAELSPVCSFRYHQWDLISAVTIGGVTWQKSARLNIARLFGFPPVSTDAELEALEYNQALVNGYDPWTRNVENPYTDFVQGSTYGSNLWRLPDGVSLDDITMKKHLTAPLKIWCGTNDPTVGTDVMKVFIKAAKNAGCTADMHILTNASHNVNSLQTAVGTFNFFGVSSPLYPVAIEVARWYRDFGGLNFTINI